LQDFEPFETVVVDNGSSDGSPDWVAAHFPDIKLIRLAKNTGFCRANNIALSDVETEFVALLNNDAVAHPLWLQNLVGALRAERRAGFAASRMLLRGSPDTIDRAGDAYTWAGAGVLRGRGLPSAAFTRREWVFGASAGAALYRTQMLEEIGLFDESYFLLYEDLDLSFRAQLRGYRCLYVADAVVYHNATQSIGADSDVSVYFGHRNLEWTFFKNMPARLLCMALVPHLLYDVAAGLYFLSIGRGRSYLRAKRDAVKELPGVLAKRTAIQRGKTVGDGYLMGLLEGERLLARYLRRRKPTDTARTTA
jgi:GT2 family glycosyltransferase